MTITIIRGTENAPLEPLKSRRVAVIGYGNQGHAHALNMRDSGIHVTLGLRPDSVSGRRALADGFQPVSIEEAASQSDLIILALPDEVQPEIFHTHISSRLQPGSVVGFLHGFNIRYGRIHIDPARDVGVVMIAPKGPGHLLRQVYLRNRGIPCLMAVHQDTHQKTAQPIALAWANAIGCARSTQGGGGIIMTTFAQETETDLFGEQAVLCGGVTYLIKAAFEILVQEGYPPELAYLECCHELKQITDLIYDRGITSMMEAISTTAEFGAHTAGPALIDDHVRQRMRDLLARIRDGSFAAEFQKDARNGFAELNRHRQSLAAHALDKSGQIIRSLTTQE